MAALRKERVSEVPQYRQRMRQSFRSEQSLSSLRFHEIHGDNIEIHVQGKVAERVVGFCDAIVFSSRPITIGEKITIHLRSIDNGWSGALRLGFTAVDPIRMASDIPKYACPDLSTRVGNWAKALSPSICKLNTIVKFHVDLAGKLQYSVNGGREDELLDGIDTSASLWAIFDLYGNTKSLEIVDSNHSNVLPPTVDPVAHITLPSDIVGTAMEKLQLSERPQPSCFSETMGTGLKCRNFTHVTRKEDNTDSSYVVFTNSKLTAGQTAYFYCAEVREHTFHRLLEEMKFGIGITTCDPATVIISEIPQDATMLMDRPEYWVFYRDFEHPNAGEYFSISVEREGLITYTRESGQKTVLFYADVYEPLYLLLDLCGAVSSLAIVGLSRVPRMTLNLLGSQSLTNGTLHVSSQSEETPSTSRYPHELDTRQQSRYPGGSTEVSHTREEVGPQPSTSSYPHGYVFCEPLIVVAPNDSSSSDDDFHEASDQPRATTRDEVDVVAALPPIGMDTLPDITELQTSLDELWRHVMHEPPPSLSVQAQEEHPTTTTKKLPEKTKGVEDVKPAKEKPAKSSNEAECVICCDVIANSVMYPCGHACLCFDCGRVILRQAQSICPICRAIVKDVIRIYQS